MYQKATFDNDCKRKLVGFLCRGYFDDYWTYKNILLDAIGLLDIVEFVEGINSAFTEFSSSILIHNIIF